ncbi:MAG: hypothetical protein J0H08_07430, partial [Rhizobiales bacterium]|nr:hypothetical protein [Hyphomicrobiales bacterium]
PGDRPYQIGDFADWERRRAAAALAEASRVWWRARFATPWPSTALPGGADDAPSGSHHVSLAAGSAAVLRARAAAARLPVASIAMTAAVLALHRITGQSQILAMTPLANRDLPETLGIIGYLNRVVPIAVTIGPATSAAALSATVAAELSEASTHRFLPSEEIVGLPGLARCHVNRLLVSWQERRRDAVQLGEAEGHEVPLARHGADFGLALQFEGDGDRLVCRLDHAEGVLGEAGAGAFAALLVSALDDIASDGWGQSVVDVAPPVCPPAALADVLSRHPAIVEAVAASDTETGRTTAWVVLDEDRPASISDLAAFVREHAGGPVPPLRLVSRAALPREPDGSIDIAALRRTADVEDAAPPEAPRTDLERIVADLWRRILWLDRPVGRNEDFRHLGGHSLLAVRMTAELEKELGRPIGWRAVGGLSTVAALAAAIEAGDGSDAPDPGGLDPEILSRLRAYTASWLGTRPFDGALIVGRNVEGPRPPLFWCLQSESELAQLARYIGDDQPVFGMRSGHAVMVKSRDNIDRLAFRYAAEVMRAAPHGPIFLGGNCQAAVIAFHVARHVQAAGREVALLILHEKVVPEPYEGRMALSFGRESTRNPYLTSSDPHADLRPYYAGPFTIDLVSGAHGQFFKEPNILDLVAMIRRRRDESVPPALSGMPGPLERGGSHVEHLA